MTDRLAGKTAIITGGTTGLGLEMARHYLAEGAKVLITGRSQSRVDAALADLGAGAIGLVADSTRLADLEALAAKAAEVFTTVDILIANAGGGVFSGIADITEADYDKQFDVNVKGVVFTVQKILPLMGKGASIILVASAVNEKGGAEASLYFASKAAVRSLARSFAAELGPRGIRVNALSPGLVPTRFFDNSNLGGAAFHGFEQGIAAAAPLGRPGTPAEIAHAAIYLGADESSYVTAADLVVDGGWMNV